MDQTSQVVDILKKLLRSRGILYQDLARELDLSLPSVKRMFSKGDFTLSRLNEVCKVIDVPMSEVFKLLDKEGASSATMLTDEQENYLAKNPSRLAYLELLLNGMNPKQIEKEFHLSEAKTIKILAELDKWNLIEWSTKNKVKLKGSEMIRLRPNGPLRKILKDKGVKSFLDGDFADKNELQEFMTFKATEETLIKLNSQIKNLVIKTSKEGLLEQKTSLQTISIGTFVAIRPWRIVDAFALD